MMLLLQLVGIGGLRNIEEYKADCRQQRRSNLRWFIGRRLYTAGDCQCLQIRHEMALSGYNMSH